MTSIASVLERYMLELINADRGAAGLAPLTLELNLNTSADLHSQWMTDTDTFDHEGVGGSSATDRMRAADMDLSGTWQTAENIAAVSMQGSSNLTDEVDRLHTNLMNSPGHRANLLDPALTVIGIGMATGPLTYDSGRFNSVLVTQNFAATEGLVDLDLAGGDGAETLVGQGGDDVIRLGTGVKQVAGGADHDTLVLENMTRAQASITQTVEGLHLTGPGLEVTASGFETLQFIDQSVAVADLFGGGAGGTPVTGTSGADLLQGDGTEAHSLTGFGGDDVLLGDGRGLYGTEVSAQVYRLYAAVFGREPDLGGHQAWVGLLASGARDLREASAGFVASPEFQQTYGALSDIEFVTLLYNNVLGRAPDVGGLASWQGNLAGGMTREAVVLHFAESGEHRALTASEQAEFDATHDPTHWMEDVYRVYAAILDRQPDLNGLTTWVDKMAGGMAFADVVAAFMASPEFQTVYGTTSDVEFLTLLYTNVLDRNPDPGGFASWSTALGAGMARETVVGRFVQSPEFVQETAAALQTFVAARGVDDVLRPGAGDDLMSGGLWVDSFVFGPGDDGDKQVTDLEPWDLVDLSGFGYADTAEAMTHVTQQGADAVFEDQGVRVVFWDAVLTQEMIYL